ncbi:MAG: hypothetical protein JWL76_1762 [Thermoleophilia bacterium]|nr:hypothetical protein [Thermoleophilia bacterium]
MAPRTGRHDLGVFVFTSVLIAATWFLARLGWDRARPDWRTRPDRARRRFVAITATGAIVAIGGFGAIIGALYGLVPGLVAAAALLPVYVFIASVLRMILSSFDEEA